MNVIFEYENLKHEQMREMKEIMSTYFWSTIVEDRFQPSQEDIFENVLFKTWKMWQFLVGFEHPTYPRKQNALGF